MVKRMSLLISFILSLMVGCSFGDRSHHVHELQQWMQPNGKVKVLSTVAMVDDLVKYVGGEYVDTSILIKGELDPHSYQMVKGDDEKLAFADIIFYNGLGLEHGPSLQNYLLRQTKAVPLGDKVMSASVQQILYFQGQVDPHLWMDISLWAKTIPYIAEALSQKDPLHAEIYRSNGIKLIETLMHTHTEMRNELQKIPSKKRYLVTSHDAFNYFTRAYLADDGEEEHIWRERFIAPEGLAPESQISATSIQDIINHLHRYQIRVLFPESNVNRDSIRKIVQAAREKGIDVKIAEVFLYADAMGKPGSDGDTYLKMIRHNVQSIATSLKQNGP